MKAKQDINRVTCCNCFFMNTCKAQHNCDFDKYQNDNQACIECINAGSFAHGCDKFRQKGSSGSVYCNGLGHQNIQ